MDESSFTGETLPCPKDVHCQQTDVGESDVSHTSSVVFMGTYVCGGHGKVRTYVGCGCG